MKEVRFFSLEDDGYHYIGHIVLRPEGVKFDGFPQSTEEELRRGVVVWNQPIQRKATLPKDGITFLKAVVSQYGHGSYFKTLQIEDVDS